MAARGPDGSGLWRDPLGRCGLAHRRLAIIDVTDAGLQPMVDEDSGDVISFNGEIYNFQELRTELVSQGVSFRTSTDTEVILKLFARQGASCFARLRGMFAIAIFSPRTGHLILARDRFGIKPLYLADDGKTFRFASQVKALRASKRAGLRPDAAGHVGFHLWGHVPEPFTLWSDIRSVEPGVALLFDPDGRHQRVPFANIAESLVRPDGRATAIGKAEAADRLRKALLEAVSYHLVADVPVGVFLSAGIDSGTLAGLAATRAPGQIQTLCLGFPEFQNSGENETVLAKEVARTFSTRHHEVLISQDDFLSVKDDLLRAMDQPTIDGVNSYFVAAAARKLGWKVALSGLGADELFAGYNSFQQIPRIVRSLQHVPAREAIGSWSRALLKSVGLSLPSPKLAKLIEMGGTWSGAYQLKRGLFLPEEISGKFATEFLKEGLGRLETESSLSQSLSGIREDRFRVQFLEMKLYMRNQLLRDADWASMAHGLEVRVPFVDHELLATVAQLVRAGAPPGKQELGATPQPRLPAQVLTRPKTGFQIPLWKWLGQAESQNRGMVSRLWAGEVYSYAVGE